MRNKFYWLGIRSPKDVFAGLLMFALLAATLYIIFGSVGLVPGISQSSSPILDLTPLTLLVAISMTLISVPWAMYAVAGLIFSPKQIGPTSEHWTPRFSVLIPARNEEKVIGNLVGDLLRQTWEQFEVVVVCHNCTDRTYDVVKKLSESDSRVRPIAFVGEKGKGVALNVGTRQSTGEVLVVLDADNRVSQGLLEGLAKYFPRYDAVQTRIEASNANFNLVTRLASLEFTAFTDSFQKSRAAFDINVGLGGTGEAVKKSVLETIGYWGNSLTEDFALFTKLTSRGYKIGWANDVEVLDEKVPWLFDMYRQRARWIKGHYQVAARDFRLFLKDPLNLHYLVAPLSIAGYYYSLFLGAAFLFGLPFRTSFMPYYIWLVPWTVFLTGMAIHIAKRRGVKSLLLYPVLLVYLYHWIAVFVGVPFIRNWDTAKTEHGFYQRREETLELKPEAERPVIIQQTPVSSIQGTVQEEKVRTRNIEAVT